MTTSWLYVIHMIMRSPKEHLHILVSQETKSLLRLKAAVTGISMSSLIEKAIKSYIEKGETYGKEEIGKGD